MWFSRRFCSFLGSEVLSWGGVLRWRRRRVSQTCCLPGRKSTMVHAGHFGFEGVAWCGLGCGVTVSNSSRFWDFKLLVQAGTCRSEMTEVEPISQFRLSPIYELKASKKVQMDQDPLLLLFLHSPIPNKHPQALLKSTPGVWSDGISALWEMLSWVAPSSSAPNAIWCKHWWRLALPCTTITLFPRTATTPFGKSKFMKKVASMRVQNTDIDDI